MPVVNCSEDTKKIFNKAKLKEEGKQGKSLSEDEYERILLGEKK
jgi:hypothetical protein